MIGWELLASRVAAGALGSAASATVRSALAPKSGALIVSNGSTGRFKNKLIPTVDVTEKDVKEFAKHVLKTIDPILEHEYRDLAESDTGAALELVISSFDSSTADVFESDFDPAIFSRRVISDSQELLTKVALGESGNRFYVRVVTEVSAQMLNFITTWPSFLARSNVEQLKRLTGLAKELQRVRRAVIDDPSAEEVAFEESYAGVVVAKLDHLELFGVTLSQPEQRPYPLSTAYISLSVAGSESSAGSNELEREIIDFTMQDGANPWASGVTDLVAESGGAIRSESAIAKHSRILLRGDAGSGKTTLLHWLSVNSSRRSFDGELRQFNGYVPFLLPLRRFADRDLPAAHDFLNEIAKHISGEMPGGWVNRALRSGRAFVLIDGVDELPESRRQEAKEWLEDLLDAYPMVRYIITSRPAAAEEKWLLQQHFTSVDMLPMSQLDIENFVHHWHQAARFCLPSDTTEEDLADLAKYELELVKAIRGQRQLQKLASNPLLCALLCTLSRDRRMQLPQGRMELYSAALEMLLVRRDVERRINHAGAPSLTLKQKQRLLGYFAYWLLRNQLTDTTEDQAVDQMRLALESMPAVSAGGAVVYRYLIVRSGLLRQPVEGRVDFIHRTFQEYLAAASIISLNDIGSLVRNAHLDQWHEVVTMAVGHARPEECSDILNQLIKRGNSEPANTARLHLLAAACLENADQLDKETYDLVRRHAAKLIPPTKVSDAKELAAVGESVLPLLPRSGRNLLAPHAASTVRTASLVGGEAALDILSGYGSDSRKSVYAELSRAWTFFDVEEYAKRVMSKSPIARRDLRIDHEQLLPTLKYFSDLTSLQCVCPVDNFDWVDHCASLKHLAVWGPNGGVVEAISRLSNLEGLALGFVDLEEESLGNLSVLKRLRVLNLNLVDSLDLKAEKIPSLKELYYLQVGGAGVVNGAFVDENLPKLTSLSFSGCGEIDLSILKGMNSLGAVHIFYCRSLVNAHAVGALSELRVHVSAASDDNLAELSKMDEIASLTIRMRRGASNRPVDLSPFKGRKDVSIRFPEPVQLTAGFSSLGDGVKVIMPSRQGS